MAISSRPAYIFNSGLQLTAQGSLAYNAETGLYTFSETQAIIEQGEVGTVQVALILPLATFSGGTPLVIFRRKDGYTSGLLTMSTATWVISVDSVETSYQVLYVTMSVVGWTYTAGRHALQASYLKVDGSYDKIDLVFYTVDDGINNYEEVTADTYEEIATQFNTTYADLLDRMTFIETFAINGLGYNETGSQTSIPFLKFYNALGLATISFDGSNFILNRNSVDEEVMTVLNNLADLANVVETSLTTDDILIYNGTNYVNITKTAFLAAVNARIGEKVDKTSIVDNLTTDDATKVLSAKQGKVLNDTTEKLVNKKSVINDSETEYPNSKAVIGVQNNIYDDMSYISNEVANLNGVQIRLENYLPNSYVRYVYEDNVTFIKSYGKNLLDYNLFSDTYLEVTPVSNVVNFYNPKPYGAESNLEIWLSVGYYTFSKSDGLGVSVRTATNTYLYGIPVGSGQTTFYISVAGNYRIQTTLDTLASGSITDLMLEIGQSKTDYELFTTAVIYTPSDDIKSTTSLLTDGDGIQVTYPTVFYKNKSSKLFNKKIIYDGDSIAYGADESGAYPKLISDVVFNNYTNHSIQGATMAFYEVGRHCISRNISNLSDEADIVVWEGGVNDMGFNVTLGDIVTSYTAVFDDTTFIGALENLFKQAYAKWTSGTKFAFVIPHRIYDLTTLFHSAWIPKIKEVCNKWGVLCIDLTNVVPPLNLISNYKTLYTYNSDGWHPNELAYKTFYVPIIISYLERFI